MTAANFAAGHSFAGPYAAAGAMAIKRRLRPPSMRRQPFAHRRDVGSIGRNREVIGVAFDAEGLAKHRKPVEHLMAFEGVATAAWPYA